MHLAFGRLFLQFTAIAKFIFTSKKTEIKGGTTLKKEAVFKKKEKKKKGTRNQISLESFFQYNCLLKEVLLRTTEIDSLRRCWDVV